ncbi:NAD-dependent deacetylase [Brevibacillus sp. NPDC058079]|uniref:SIR2 family NAD-dependent protein deacylase n=1 Tax=Brevibacillus sp. NPDC058079 TaxID=3346330 RepID=UPI0036E35CCC
MDPIKTLAEWIRQAKKINVLSGAGISTESGIPDFRSSTGVWTYDLSRQQLMSLSYFNRQREKFWVAYKDIFHIKLAGDFQPNYGHEFLFELEKQGKNISIFTQNVDGLHQASGSTRVYEVHGSMRLAYCTNCGEEYDLEYIRREEVPVCRKVEVKENVCNHYIPLSGHPFNFVNCTECGTRHDLHHASTEGIRCKGKKKREVKCHHILKPDVVLFGDSIRYYQEAKRSAVQADLLLVLGSSLQVGPINEIPMFYPQYKNSVIINNHSTDLDSFFKLVINESISDTFRQVSDLLEINLST